MPDVASGSGCCRPSSGPAALRLFVAAFPVLALAYKANLPTKQPPHILFVVVDDLGWADVGYHHSFAELHVPAPVHHDVRIDLKIRTPTIDALVRDGIELNRHYVHMMCTPSRSALQTGRLPVHVITELADPCDSNGAIPRNMTGIASKLKRAGYATHHVGKWDAGMATPHHTPHGRGYDTSLNYFGHGNWMWSEAEWGGSEDHRASYPALGLVDLWDTDRPAADRNGTGFEEQLFRERILSILRAHDPATPLFLQYDSRLAHYPLQAPLEYQRHVAHIADANRRLYHAMVSYLDDQLANITGTMRALGLWEKTLMVLTSDNGGPVKSPDGECNTTVAPQPSPADDVGHGLACFNGEAGASNYPLRGGKYSMWEGGIRAAAFVSGGFLPPGVRGTRLDGMIHIADWYGTLCALAGVDPYDLWAAESALPPVDSVNMWPMLSGANLTSPRISVLVNEDVLLHGEWKYVRGGTKMVASARGGPQYPNASSSDDPIFSHSLTCPAQGCLFNVVQDPEEREEVGSGHRALVASLGQELARQAAHIWSVPHNVDPKCREFAESHYAGFLGPFREVTEALRREASSYQGIRR